jgi:NADH-quinone oxidoreductase subunit G
MTTIPIQADGREIQAEAGAPLLQVLLDNGIFVPHYCYHPGLSVAGNCRMCLVKIAGRPKLETSCTVRVTAPMVVETQAPEVLKARRDVLEYLLINHPLDCPVCDQAGECLLQDFSYAHGGDRSRFTESKVIRGSRPLGPLVHYWGNRCIACTRCVRFCDEIAGTGELAVTGRSDRVEIDVFRGRPLDNPLSGNVVDICPVGALLSRDFLYQARVWFLRSTDTICPGCSRGCNIRVDALGNAVKRLRPRPNRAVNGFWMCDAGRLVYKSLSLASRLVAHRVQGFEGPFSLERAAGDAADRIQESLRRASPSAMAGLASASATNEALHLFRRLCARLGIPVLACRTRRDGGSRRFPGGFRIDAEKAPNRLGAEWLLGTETVDYGMERLDAAAKSGALRALLVLGGDPAGPVPENLLPSLERVEVPVAIDAYDSPLARHAGVTLAAAAWAESDGTMVNSDGRVQRLRRAIAPPGDALPAVAILQELLVLAGEKREILSAEGVFRGMTAEHPAFAGMTWTGIGLHGASGAGTVAGTDVR